MEELCRKKEKKAEKSRRALFQKEEDLLANAQAALNDEEIDFEGLKKEFATLTRGYKRLLRQMVHITKVSDRHQNRLHTTTEELDHELGRQVGVEIKEEILKSYKHGEIIRKRDLTIVFIDIRGFTTFAENRRPDEVITFLKNYYEYSLEIVHKHDGLVKSFMGDGVMLVFGFRENRPSADSAIAFAIEIIERLPEFNERHQSNVRLGIGMHNGPTAAGQIGNEARSEFAVIGNTVNMASRIESLTKEYNTSLLFSEDVPCTHA